VTLGLVAMSAASVLADGDTGGGEAKKAGPIALVVILVLCVACYFLFRSMTRHLRKVREEFPDDQPAAPDDEPRNDGSSNGSNGSSSARPGRGPSPP
jgi:hypothetical protein